MKNRIKSLLIGGCLVIGMSSLQAQEKQIAVSSFDNVVISPHIEVTFVEGNREMVTIEDSDVPLEKINVKVDGKTLKLYLDGAKDYTKSKKVKTDEYKGRQQLYHGTKVTATVSYKHLNKLIVKGEEMIRLNSPLQQNDFDLTVYGESDVLVKSADLDNLKVVMYGESYLKFDEGEVDFQKYKTFGESEVNALNLSTRSAKVTAFGESELMLNVSERLKVTSYGESEINYKGSPSIDKGVVLGENSISKL